MPEAPALSRRGFAVFEIWPLGGTKTAKEERLLVLLPSAEHEQSFFFRPFSNDTDRLPSAFFLPPPRLDERRRLDGEPAEEGGAHHAAGEVAHDSSTRG